MEDDGDESNTDTWLRWEGWWLEAVVMCEAGDTRGRKARLVAMAAMLA